MNTGARTALTVGLLVATAAVTGTVLLRQDQGASPAPTSSAASTSSGVESTTTAPPVVYTSGWNRLPDPPLEPRTGAVTAVVGDEVYVLGGSEFVCRAGDNCIQNGRVFGDGAAYDMVRGTWRPLAPAPIEVPSTSTAVIGDDIFVLAGAADFGLEMRLLRYSTLDDIWTEVGDLPETLGIGLAAHGDRLVVYSFAGMTSADEWVYDLSSGTWTRLPGHGLSADASRWLRGTTAGLLLVTIDDQHATTVLRLADDDSEWVTLTSGEVRGASHLVVDSTVLFSPYAYDGSEGGVFDAETLVWSPIPPFPEGSGITTTAVGLITDAGVAIIDREGPVWDARASVWVTLTKLDDRDWPATAGLPVGQLVFGGQDWSTVIDTGGIDTESPLLADAWLWVAPPAP